MSSRWSLAGEASMAGAQAKRLRNRVATSCTAKVFMGRYPWKDRSKSRSIMTCLGCPCQRTPFTSDGTPCLRWERKGKIVVFRGRRHNGFAEGRKEEQ